MRRLPPIPPLVAFEAVARLGSFTRAADELGLTQSAVSHRLSGLERHFGVRLIERLNPGLRVTAAGAALLPDLGRALDLLDGLARDAVARGRPLRLGVGSALATWWLARRLPAFLAAHPAIAIELVPFENADEAARAEVDLRVLWVTAAQARPSPTQRPLFRESVFPVCRPTLLPGGKPLGERDALRRLPLIHKGPGGARDGTAGEEWHWRTWLGRIGMPPALRFREIGPALAAAVDGAGVALGRSLLVQDAIADGRLAPALGPAHRLPSSKVHVARWPTALAGDRRIATLVAWLHAEAARSVAEVDRRTASPARGDRRRTAAA